MLTKRTFKVIAPMPTGDGGTYWMRCGTGYVNKDNSINMLINALPVGVTQLKLQLREMTDEDIRRSAEKRATYQSRGSLGGGGPLGGAGDIEPGAYAGGGGASAPSFASDVPF